MIIKEQLPHQAFYAVIFSSVKSDDLEGYTEMDEKTLKLAQEQKGYLGYEAVADDKRSIFISYWESMEDIRVWGEHAVHKMAKAQAGRWYKRYLSQICRVESSRYWEQD
ncbi:MAG TPA: antibiotic biosynthesis monooxygenase [Bacteroidia bacterium]|nr:antibiotic biosynthesis monooxygenase [Bacteroidia bacterium]